jgi:galactose mutarotase-like enzyme
MTPPTAIAADPDAATPVAYTRTDTTLGGLDVVSLGSPSGLEAAFTPQVDMTCCSLRLGGAELLSERFGIEAYASCGMTMGMSLMHPWADRLSSWSYTACGATVRLPVSPRLHTDRLGLPVNGVQPRGDAWVVEGSHGTDESAWLDATLPFDSDPRQLELFPFPHRLHLHTEISGLSFYISAELEATGRVPVPVCFGYRVYLRREQPGGGGTIVLPDRRRLVTDERLLPTGASELRQMSASTLGIDEVHEVFAFEADRRITVASDARRLTVEALDGFPLAQVSAVDGQPDVMLEALTAAPDALSRDAFPLAMPGRPYRASLQLSVDDLLADRRFLNNPISPGGNHVR